MSSEAQQPETLGHEVDIDRQRLGTVYAKALLGATEPKQQSDDVVDELCELVDSVLARSPAFAEALGSPRITADEKAALLDRVFGDKMSEALLTFLKVVGKHGRLDCLREIRQAARTELNILRQRVEVHVTTADPISDELRGRIGDQLAQKLGQEIDLVCHVDAAIIGGMLVRVGDTVFDSSVANRLSQIQQEAINKTISQFREATDRFAVTG